MTTATLSITSAKTWLTVRTGPQVHLNETLSCRPDDVPALMAEDVLAANGWRMAGSWLQDFGGLSGAVIEAEVTR